MKGQNKTLVLCPCPGVDLSRLVRPGACASEEPRLWLLGTHPFPLDCGCLSLGSCPGVLCSPCQHCLTQLSADLGFPLPANSAYDAVLLNELPWHKWPACVRSPGFSYWFFFFISCLLLDGDKWNPMWGTSMGQVALSAASTCPKPTGTRTQN